MEKTSEITKMEMWHKGERNLNVGACSDEKLRRYIGICRKLGFSKEASTLQAELSKRNSASDLESLTSEERFEMLKSKLERLAWGDDVYFYPKSKKGWEGIKSSFIKHYDADPAYKKERASEWEYEEGNLGGEFGLYCADGEGLQMELDFESVDFIDLPVEMQIACLDSEWMTD